MGISHYPSRVTLPDVKRAYPSILDFLVTRFPTIPRDCWEQRIAEGKVLNGDGHQITMESAYIPHTQILYFREVEGERVIPFQEEILFHNDNLLVACKPHFLPVTPGGAFVDECLLNRLRKRTGIDYLAPIHRIDRETAGIVMFSVNRKSSDLYHALFRNGKVEKTYQALSAYIPDRETSEWMVEDRIVQGDPWFRMKTASGEVNARSRVHLVEVRGKQARFLLSPFTGRTHQLRLHMSGLGFGILNDRLYPDLQPETADDFNRPLQLIAKRVRFRDPVSGNDMEFVSECRLMW